MNIDMFVDMAKDSASVNLVEIVFRFCLLINCAIEEYERVFLRALPSVKVVRKWGIAAPGKYSASVNYLGVKLD